MVQKIFSSHTPTDCLAHMPLWRWLIQAKEVGVHQTRWHSWAKGHLTPGRFPCSCIIYLICCDLFNLPADTQSKRTPVLNQQTRACFINLSCWIWVQTLKAINFPQNSPETEIRSSLTMKRASKQINLKLLKDLFLRSLNGSIAKLAHPRRAYTFPNYYYFYV